MKSKKRKSPGSQNEILLIQKGEQALTAGQFAQAANSFSGISKNSANYGRACKGHGAALVRLQRFTEALDIIQAAHEAFPTDPDILVDGGDAARILGGLDIAEIAYKEARRLGADGYQIRFGEAMICVERGLWVKAVELLTGLRESYPKDHLVAHNLGRAWHELGETDQAVSLMREAFATGGEIMTLTMLGVLSPHAGVCSHEDVLRIRTKLGEELKLRETIRRDPRSRDHSGRINIGYVSAFFHHRNWMKPVWALLNNQDRERFNVHLFADGPTEEIGSQSGYVPNIQDSIYDTRKLGNKELADLIRDQNIDVLVDLNGYSAVPRLGLWTSKSAPITIGWFNQYATSGLPGIEWLIGDNVVIDPEEEKFYTEKILRLKQSYLTFQVVYNTPDVETPVNRGPFTFGCLGSAYKITPEVRNAWSRLLKETENTRLLVRNRLLGEEAHRQWFLKFFTGGGVDPARVILLGPAEHEEFIRTYGQIDLALDTFPYNGGTTTMEALWQGVPVVCFRGDRWVSRTSATIIHSAGLQEFLGRDEVEYIEIAKQWSRPEQRNKLKALRSEMRSRLQMSSVCDGPGLARDFEGIVFELLRAEGYSEFMTSELTG